MSNGVEDLERQVAELQAAVNGLTEELVEMKERVRQLEDAQAAPAEETATENASADAPADGDRTTHSDDHVDVFEPTGADAGDGDDTADATDSEGSATPDAEAGGGDDGDDGEPSDDIIVA